jgi:hypothetical protein
MIKVPRVHCCRYLNFMGAWSNIQFYRRVNAVNFTCYWAYPTDRLVSAESANKNIETLY